MLDPYRAAVISIRTAMRVSDGRSVTGRGGAGSIGLQTWPFCVLSDLSKQFIRVMNADDDWMDAMNFGNPIEFAIWELAERVNALVGSGSNSLSQE